MYHMSSLALAGLLALALSARADDWPQWRGPDRTDISREKGLLTSWPAEGPKLLWTYTDAGSGYSGFSVVGDRVLTMGADDKKEYVLALDARTGKRVWQTEIGERFRNDPWGDGPRGTPTVDGDVLYALGGQGNLVCLDLAKGKLLWSRNLQKDLGGQMMSGWGYTESPLVDGDRLVCTPGGPKGTIAALDKKTGEVVWRSKGYTDKAAYSSLVIGRAGGVKQYVQMTGDSVAGVAAADGRLLWRFPRNSPTAAVPTPLVVDDLVYATSAYGAGAHLIRVVPGDDGTMKAEEVYHSRDMENHHGGVILLDGHVYGASNNGGWMCQDLKTGKVVWKGRELGKTLGNGSLTGAGGRFVLYSEDKGTVVLLEPSPEKKWQEHGRFTIPRQTKIRSSNGRIWTHPVVANGRLYLRDQDLIYCYDVKSAD